MSDDRVRLFLFEQLPLRGHWVRLGAAWRELLKHPDYSPPVRALLGEATAAAVLLASTLKFEGTLTLQLEGDGAVRLLVAQCTHDFRLRSVARVDATRPVTDFRSLVGQGRVVVTVEAEERASRYQGIVALEGDSLAACLETYFETSEQLPTMVTLAADGERAAGMIVQRVATQGGRSDGDAPVVSATELERVWESARMSIDTLDRDLLLGLDAESVLRASFPRHDVRLFGGSPAQFQCRCDDARVANILRALGPEEVREVLAEQGAVTVTCEFCQRPYRFDAVDIERVFSTAVVAAGSQSIN